MENYFLPVKLLKHMAILNNSPPHPNEDSSLLAWDIKCRFYKNLNVVGLPGFFFMPA